MKLKTKLIVAFGVIVLLMGASQSFFLQSRIQSTFEKYLQQQNVGFMERMAQTLEQYYAETGSWKDVQSFFNDLSPTGGRGPGMMNQGMHMAMSNMDILLVDNKGKIIADSAGTRIGESGIDYKGHSIALIINGKKVGTLVFHQYKLQQLEKEFLTSANMAILFSSLIASVMAVLLSIFIAKKISNPLLNLMKGIKRITNGEKVPEINISTKDEFGELGAAFNDMSRKLERNEEIRQSLVADVAHELRTPLTILQGKLESIQEGAILPSEQTILELTDEVYRLNRLVKDLQQLSLAEAGKLPLHLAPVNLKPFLDRICHQFQWLAEEKGITLRYERIPEKCFLEIDADRMTQVIVNLLGNAIRHTPKNGLVEVAVEDKGNTVVIKICDSGQGISKEALPFVFNRFYKGDPSRSRNESGTGLGLSIAKGFVEAHGGTIHVQSELNIGTTFTIVLQNNKSVFQS